MGLDNEIIIKHSEDSEEICYWRKCWNIRNGILEIVNHEYEYDYPLSTEDVTKIISFLKSLNKYNWDNNGGSIWTWEEIKPSLKKNIKILKKLLKRMKKNSNLKVIFYDSY